jgi:hypothetical protein
MSHVALHVTYWNYIFIIQGYARRSLDHYVTQNKYCNFSRTHVISKRTNLPPRAKRLSLRSFTQLQPRPTKNDGIV